MAERRINVASNAVNGRTGRPAVFLDRDGVLNQELFRDGRPCPPRNVSELVIVDGARSALEVLKGYGFMLIVVTNQPDLARGRARRADVEEINTRLARTLPLDAIVVCEHDDKDECECRKPKPGMMLRAQEKYGIEICRSFVIGDRWRDIEAGRRAGCRTILIGDGHGEAFPSMPTVRVDSLPEAVAWITQQKSSQRTLHEN
jgi:D-glycero-D-manno-heptose 1,7-bisphosphate phosphatase